MNDGTRSSHHSEQSGEALLRTLLRIILAAGGASLFTTASWFALSRPQFPAYSESYVLKALATACIALATLATAGAMYLWIHREQGAGRGAGRGASGGARVRELLITAIAYLAPAGMVVAAIAIPLAATRLYLDGISVDQVFRTQYLTRMADHPTWQDMAYPDMPSFYPGLWFFTGGLFAKITGLAGWAAFKPWALITLAATASALVPIWQRLLGSLPLATAIGLASTIVMLHTAPEEPYAAIVALGMPAAMVIGYRAVLTHRWAPLLAVTAYLGLSANLYTLYTGLSALTLIVIALVAAARTRSARPLLRLTLIGSGSIALALIGWGPYLYALATRPHGPTGTAQHYLPDVGTEFPFPFLDSLGLGVLTIAGALWLILRAPASLRNPTTLADASSRLRFHTARALGLGVLVCYGWVLASMLITLFGTTLLGFRLELPISLLLATAGILGIAEFRLEWLTGALRYARAQRGDAAAAATRGGGANARGEAAETGAASASEKREQREARERHEQRERREARAMNAVLAVGMTVACIAYATSIPATIEERIDLAYTDTDGDAIRGDLQPADSTYYYRDIDAVLREKLRLGESERARAVILSDEKNFMALYPYHAYQALTAHYANPLGEFAARNDMIESWTELDTPEQLHTAIDAAAAERGWRAPDAMVLRGVAGEDEDYGYLLADDIYPSNPNVRFRTVHFPAELFAQGWDLTQVGPFVVAVRDIGPAVT